MDSLKMEGGTRQRRALTSFSPRDFLKTNIKPVTIGLAVIGKWSTFSFSFFTLNPPVLWRGEFDRKVLIILLAGVLACLSTVLSVQLSPDSNKEPPDWPSLSADLLTHPASQTKQFPGLCTRWLPIKTRCGEPSLTKRVEGVGRSWGVIKTSLSSTSNKTQACLQALHQQLFQFEPLKISTTPILHAAVIYLIKSFHHRKDQRSCCDLIGNELLSL